ncbi:hypothetical protein Ae201684P_010670 [Aphanomyces euteiches]|nr:hypothetical protein Ae201684P_010670 [Aphanomyces euteiches]
MTRLMQVTQTYADRRRQAAREENLEMALGYLQAHPEDQRKKINPFAYTENGGSIGSADGIFHQQDHILWM